MGRKTFWHLEGRRRMPTEYELLTSKLLWYPERGGFEVDVPLGAFYERWQRGSPLSCDDWERFADPRATTYASWVALEAKREAFVDALLEGIETSGYDAVLSAEARSLLAGPIAVLRYPVHALQMVAAYVGSMAPSGRIVVAALFQAGDEMRRVQRFAYRLALLRRTHAHAGDDARAAWERAPVWQPLRSALEDLLVTYDWGEALVALNACIKPALDCLFGPALGERAREAGDYVLDQLLGSLAEDERWHREWTAALLATAFDAAAGEGAPARAAANRAAIQAWIDRWHPRTMEAIAPFAERLGEKAVADARAAARAYLRDVGLAPHTGDRVD